MSFNEKNWADALRRSSNYIASPTFRDEAFWHRPSPGSASSILYSNTPPAPKVVVVVGIADAERAHCGPLGNFTASLDLAKSKYELYLTKPNSEHFSSDFPLAVQTMGKLEDLERCKAITFTVTEKVGKTDMLKLGGKIFKKRNVPLEKPTMNGDGSYNQPDFNDTTLRWPVPSVYREHFNKIKFEYEVSPLLAFDVDESVIPPLEIQDKIRGCLVEVAFTLRHHVFNDGKEYFTPEIKQVRILERLGFTVESDRFLQGMAVGRPVSFGVVLPVGNEEDGLVASGSDTASAGSSRDGDDASKKMDEMQGNSAEGRGDGKQAEIVLVHASAHGKGGDGGLDGKLPEKGPVGGSLATKHTVEGLAAAGDKRAGGTVTAGEEPAPKKARMEK
ncbi:hypothetical protein BDN72DRAFT_897376 [Pluteus cervinus]|uniref:Uncharacterized protein n=1 Tax=Pluteus cervinus TaxID=181527 RepID=A0ACD3AU56_9AGAR|nr:hypothetical protein BDN72DRAFT_897376 [Pluteus cervinus]